MSEGKDPLIDENTDEYVLLAMQEKAWQLVDELKKAQEDMEKKLLTYTESKNKYSYLKTKLISIAKFLNKYNSEAVDDWFETLGLKE